MSKELRASCQRMGIGFEELSLQKHGRSWLVANRAYPRPESAALAYFVGQGWQGTRCEGGPVLLAMKTAGFKWVVKNNFFKDVDDAVNRFLEAAIQISIDHSDEFVKEVSICSRYTYRENFMKIYESELIQHYYPGITLEFMMNLYSALGERLAAIAKIFVTAPYDYRSGWPDLCLVRNGAVKFVEVKTSDALQTSQIRLIGQILRPLEFDVLVLKLSEPPKS